MSLTPTGWELRWTLRLHTNRSKPTYWWQRVGALLLRCIHRLLQLDPHKAWLCVDDLLMALCRDKADQRFALVVLLLQVLKPPVSWKALVGDTLIWCGWRFCFSSDTVQQEPATVQKLLSQIQELLSSKKADRKLLSCLGLLLWATSTALYLRSFTGPLDFDLHSPSSKGYSINAMQWNQLPHVLNEDATLCRQIPGRWLPSPAR